LDVKPSYGKKDGILLSIAGFKYARATRSYASSFGIEDKVKHII